MVIDASVWVSYFIADDTNHVATVSWLEGAIRAGSPLAAPTLLLPEVAGAVTRRTGSADMGEEATQGLMAVPSIKLVTPDERLMLLAARVAATLPVRGADAVYIATAEALGVPLITWDTEQRTRGRLIVATASPGDGL